MLRVLIGALALAALPSLGWAAAPEFAGTAWQLVAIQSMDDAQGTTTVDDPGRFTLEFGRDGRVAFRLDCNRATASVTLTPAADGSSGSIAFGPIAGTRALCPPPHLDERIVRDMAHVSGYLLKEGKLYLSLMADAGIYEWAPLHAAGTVRDQDRIVKPVRFAKGTSKAVIRGRITGRQYIDYRVRAGAGQTLKASLERSHLASYFNLLPPESDNVAMYVGQIGENRFEGLLPTDGVYTLRVYLMRSAARRGEHSDFTLSLEITGQPLLPVSGKVDAKFPGTPYHARTTVRCEPAYSQARECEAWVIRRGFDGTATVELRWDNAGKRRILFVKGKPEASDSSHGMTFKRDERGWFIVFDGDERFEVPEPLVFGG